MVKVAAAAVMTALLFAPALPAQEKSGKIEITAFGVNMSNVGRAAAQVVEISINEWTTPEQRAHLITTMIEKGQNALLSELQKTRITAGFASRTGADLIRTTRASATTCTTPGRS